MSEWKQGGSEHYKTGGVEPIDLYASGGMLRHFALASIIKYAFRNRDSSTPISSKDMGKIIHYATILLQEDCLSKSEDYQKIG